MASCHRVYNQTRSCYWKRNQAAKAVENCAAQWVEFNVIIRDLSLAESIAMRAQQEKQREPLPLAELRNCIFRFRDYAAVIRERINAREADKLVEPATT